MQFSRLHFSSCLFVHILFSEIFSHSQPYGTRGPVYMYADCVTEMTTFQVRVRGYL